MRDIEIYNRTEMRVESGLKDFVKRGEWMKNSSFGLPAHFVMGDQAHKTTNTDKVLITKTSSLVFLLFYNVFFILDKHGRIFAF